VEIIENPTIADGVLVIKARDGDSRAFDALVLRYHRQAVSIAFSILGNWEVAKDASQNAFMKAYFGLQNFRQASTFKTWLIRIVLNEAKNAARKDRFRRLFVSKEKNYDAPTEQDDLFEVIPSQEKSPKEILEDRERKDTFEQAIQQLPEKEKNVFILRYAHELPLIEIAEILHIALGTVKAHLSHANEKIKKELEPKKGTRGD